MLKLMVAPHAAPTLAVMADSGHSRRGARRRAAISRASRTWSKAEAAIGARADAMRRLGALGVAVTEDAERLSQRLRLTNAEFERLMALEYWWRVAPAAGEHAARALLYQLGPESFTDRVLVAWSRSDAGAADHRWHELATLPQRWTAPRLSAQGDGFHQPRRAERPGNGRSAARRRTGLDRCGFSARPRRNRCDYRSGRSYCAIVEGRLHLRS